MASKSLVTGRPLLTGGAGLAAIAALLAVGPAQAVPGRSAAATTPQTAPVATAAPRLTTDTNAGCNAKQRPGFARCFAVVRTPANHLLTASTSGPPATALGPADIQNAYQLPATGGGQTVAIVDAYGNTHAESDLAAFRSFYGLPPCTTANGCFKKVDQTGGTNYPADDPGWGLETSLDLDAVSAACSILLVEGNSAGLDDLARYVSNSYGTGEFAGEQSFDHYYDHPGVAVTVSSGDAGNVTSWPATDPNVTSVGGTLLTRDTSVPRGWDETVWGSSSGGEGGGSGCSPFEPQPDYQAGISTDCAYRATADIAADASPQSGLATYDTLGQTGWLQVGGTSLAAPLLASMYALAGTPTAGTYPVTHLYHDPNPASDLFDVTQGSNGSCGSVLCNAGTGWDGPTGGRPAGRDHGAGHQRRHRQATARRHGDGQPRQLQDTCRRQWRLHARRHGKHLHRDRGRIRVPACHQDRGAGQREPGQHGQLHPDRTAARHGVGDRHRRVRARVAAVRADHHRRLPGRARLHQPVHWAIQRAAGRLDHLHRARVGRLPPGRPTTR